MGHGATFEILLPAIPEEDRPAAREAPRPVGPRGSETILVVEDESAVRLLTRVVLERHGYQVLEASTGIEALRVWDQSPGPIHLVLTDIVMSEGIDGRQPDLRVVLTSGYSAEIAGRELALRPGQNFIQKPSFLHEILETVRRCLDG